MTDQRVKVTTDPGIGPVERELRSSVRLLAESDVAASESPAGPVYVQPTALNASSNHRTLEIETVKLSEDIDPRKLPTQLTLQRPPGLPPPGAPRFDSGWPQAELTLTSSQRPAPPRHPWRIPALLLTLVGAVLLLLWVRASAHRNEGAAAATTEVVTSGSKAPAAVPEATQPTLVIGPSVVASSEQQLLAQPSSVVPSPAELAPSPTPVVPSAVPERSAVRASAPPSGAEVGSGISRSHSSSKAKGEATAVSQALTAPTTQKPKRAIY